jgi:hypothetical protein
MYIDNVPGNVWTQDYITAGAEGGFWQSFDQLQESVWDDTKQITTLFEAGTREKSALAQDRDKPAVSPILETDKCSCELRTASRVAFGEYQRARNLFDEWEVSGNIEDACGRELRTWKLTGRLCYLISP